ncbi:glycine cleavage system aminomethyltransferase GcvT [Candidatus Macondimonas diazotrophica]|uniref:Aminomethyltransferase n=1 Tax=Candidatus Macondimonas diazotrophica TaxID=2305248 RepID=A0A4Z0F9P2_9GAMM|nr:glycine cleavage system aminomethyltransferase GcvT [Candidatus Macondimonas diazotrophica]NCU00870.1 glycine cleavage system aminomethyltransferase GcvT [Candidatus Macondimonas diazotrophica]TFZ82536.1 glycine cleavage system aminomethyltransferase GcvT [Candidatus Macondimonas diazotrophica]
MNQRTALYDSHVAASARLVPFSGWDMPLHYGSQLQEHHHVRAEVGVFDVSHMTVIDLSGPDAKAFLRLLLANDVARLSHPGHALYSCMLNAEGGILDDLIVYFRGEDRYRLVVNAATRERDLAWIEARRTEIGGATELIHRTDLAMLALQGPMAERALGHVVSAETLTAVRALKAFQFVERPEGFIARTGYTGEDGFEILLSVGAAPGMWHALLAAGVQPCGLGARDTLRLEAGLSLYGTDLDDAHTPNECGLGWTVAMAPPERSFMGRAALEAATPRCRQVGLVLQGRGVLRNGLVVRFADGTEGRITSGGFSPTLQRAIALARVPVQASGLHQCEVLLRGQALKARVVKPPFVRHGVASIDLDAL